VASGPDGVDFDDLTEQVRRAEDAGLRPRALYVMPDFANPSGVSLTVPLRHRLLEVAAAQGILLLEDNPYGTFHDGTALPTLKSLDTERQVVYLGSFAKTAFPAARVGYAVADQRVAGSDGAVSLFSDHLSKIKSMLTVNTSSVTQAIVAGKLLAHDYSLIKANEREMMIYRENRHQILAGLAARFPAPDGAVSGTGTVPGTGDVPGMTPSATVTWNSPAGGFFVVVSLPIPADDELLEYSARQYGVLWTPMCHFYDGPGGLYQARLACSQVNRAEIETGLDRFAALVTDATARSRT
jgi:(S)-3,5-dihydroxyphenylglycine transaminase